VGVAANVRTSTSLPVLDVVAAANVKATTSLDVRQTSDTTLGLRSEPDIGHSVGGNSAPATSGFSPTLSL